MVYIGSGGASDDAVFDPLLDVSQCNIDAGLMKKLGTNTVRVLAVDGSQNHDGCMQADASQGIYVWVSLANPAHTISPVRLGSLLAPKSSLKTDTDVDEHRGLLTGPWTCSRTGQQP